MSIGSYSVNVAKGVAEDAWGFLGKLKEIFPAFSCFWDIELPMNVIKNNQNQIKITEGPSVVSVSSPYLVKFNKDSWSSRSNKYSLPGIENTESNTIKLRVIEDNLARASRYAMAYKNCIRNPDGTYNYPFNYIDNLKFNIYTNKGQLLLTFNFAVWLVEAAFSNTNFGYESEDTRIVYMNYEFSVIDFSLELNKATIDFLKNKANELYNDALDWAGKQIDNALDWAFGDTKTAKWLKEVSKNETFKGLSDLAEITGLSKRTIF